MSRRRGFAAAVLAALALLVAGCGSGPSAGGTGAPSGSTSPSGGGSAAPASGHRYSNPVFSGDFPDPGVLHDGTTYWAFGTNGSNANVQVISSPDLVDWTRHADALPTLPSWATPGNTWAPEVVKWHGRYHLYYVARATKPGVQCIGHATANQPQGPYQDVSAAPLVCQADMGGSIDPDPFLGSDGHLYLTWKNDGNCCHDPVWLWSQQLRDDGAAPVGRRARLLTNTKMWQGTLVEAPEMVHHGSAWVLFYSANNYASADYAIGYAQCDGPLGPCHDRSSKPLVSSTADAAGPGHCFVVTTPGGATWMLLHAWQPDAIGSVIPGRQLWLEPVRWHGATPVVTPLTTAPQPAPDA